MKWEGGKKIKIINDVRCDKLGAIRGLGWLLKS